MLPGEWSRGGDSSEDEGLPQDGHSEHKAAIDAARQILEGPSVVVQRARLLQLTALLREALRLLERTLDEADA